MRSQHARRQKLLCRWLHVLLRKVHHAVAPPTIAAPSNSLLAMPPSPCHSRATASTYIAFKNGELGTEQGPAARQEVRLPNNYACIRREARRNVYAEECTGAEMGCWLGGADSTPLRGVLGEGAEAAGVGLRLVAAQVAASSARTGAQPLCQTAPWHAP